MTDMFQRIAFYRMPLRVAFMRNVLQRMKNVPYAKRLQYNALRRAEYGYCIYNAALLARALGQPEISIIEFGVAGGSGLLNIEMHVREIQKELGIKFQVYGFDTATGLPKPQDYRDMPYMWDEGFYSMDRQLLESKLEFATLVIGDVRQTASEFFDQYAPAPLGALLFDLDYYSSTIGAFNIFDCSPEQRLPRVYCYFDDIFSEGQRANNDYVGVRRAINEFNEGESARKLAQIGGLTQSRRLPAPWNEQIYVYHDFEHPRYCDFIGNPFRELPLQ